MRIIVVILAHITLGSFLRQVIYSWKRLEAVPDYLLNSPWVSQTVL